MSRWQEESDPANDWAADDDDWGVGGRDDDGSDAIISCPACGADVYEDSPACPACGEYIVDDNEFATRHPGATGFWADRPAWWIWLGFLGVIATIIALL
ncbi:MAG: hypothetical protein O3A00_13205 [Planctomycetota bacterium]|nr:hypothetical protein [Planctomycetota bacterium]